MIGTFINDWRRAADVTQAELSKRLKGHGWALTPARLSGIETRAAKGIDSKLTFNQCDILARATEAPRWEVYMHAGLIPAELRESRPSHTRLMVATALLYAALDKPELGPEISHDVALEVGLIRPATLEDHARLEQELLASGSRPLTEEEKRITNKAADAVVGEEARAERPAPQKPAGRITNKDLVGLYGGGE